MTAVQNLNCVTAYSYLTTRCVRLELFWTLVYIIMDLQFRHRKNCVVQDEWCSFTITQEGFLQLVLITLTSFYGSELIYFSRGERGKLTLFSNNGAKTVRRPDFDQAEITEINFGCLNTLLMKKNPNIAVFGAFALLMPTWRRYWMASQENLISICHLSENAASEMFRVMSYPVRNMKYPFIGRHIFDVSER